MKIDYREGLSNEQVQERIAEGKVNVAVDSNSKTVKDIVKSNVFTYFNLIFTVLAIMLIIAGSFRDLTFLPVIIANTLIGIVQEVRAKKIVDNVTMLNVPRVTVVREGKEKTLPPEELVVDGMDAIDQWSVGFLRDGAYRAYVSTARRKQDPKLETMLELPLFRGQVAISLVDVLGNRTLWVADEQ